MWGYRELAPSGCALQAVTDSDGKAIAARWDVTNS
jgi:hypothetical protein